MKISGSLGVGALTPVTTERLQAPIPDASSSKVADGFTFSSTARARAEGSGHPRWGGLSAKAHAEPEIADQIAYDFAHHVTEPSLDATEFLNGTGPLRYSATGEPYTPESKARYEKLAHDLQTASIDLYNQERAKGTDPADILDKLVALGDSQPEEFRGMASWDTALR